MGYDFEQLVPSAPPAREDPEQILAQALTEAERIRVEAHAVGHAEGRTAGHAQGAAEVARLADTLTQAAAGIEALRAEVVEAVEHDAIDLGLRLAGQVVAGVAELRAELVAQAVSGALARLAERHRIAVLVNPEDLDLVKDATATQATAGGVEHCEIRADPRVAPGGAIVSTEQGDLDAGALTQLERAREIVEASLASERAA